ncbi:MAG: hypothetical protein Q3972_01670, partial [Corynebacterium sp.]|nr:hypothetical protein [Corynebacterium sp.]
TLTPTQLPDQAEIFLKATPTRDELEQCLNSDDTSNRRYRTAKELANIQERERHRINTQGKRHRRHKTKKKTD